LTPSQSRSRTPDGSVKGRPLACAKVPGAWPIMRIREALDPLKIGLGVTGKGFDDSRQTSHFRISCFKRSIIDISSLMLTTVSSLFLVTLYQLCLRHRCHELDRFVKLFILTLLIWGGMSLAALAQTLSSVSYSGSDIVLGVSKTNEVKVFAVGQGKPRIVIDVPSGKVNINGQTLKKGPISFDGQGGVKRVRVAMRDKGVRVVLDLNQGVSFKNHLISDGDVTISLKGIGQNIVSTLPVSTGPRFFKNAIPYPRLKPDMVTKPRRKPVIVIDPGHGGYDPGAIGVRGTKEKTITAAAAKELQRQLLATGRYRVMVTRSRDIYVDHEERLRIARAGGADLFISIHADSAGNKTARGASVYTLADRAKNRSKRIVNNQNWIMDVDLTQQSDPVGDILVDLAQRKTETQSEQFADLLLKNLEGSTKLIGNSHRRAGYFVLLAPDVPAILLELGFLSNAQDEKLLNSGSHRKKVLRSVTRSINSYFDKIER